MRDVESNVITTDVKNIAPRSLVVAGRDPVRFQSSSQRIEHALLWVLLGLGVFCPFLAPFSPCSMDCQGVAVQSPTSKKHNTHKNTYLFKPYGT
jgi:hypothetical protein